MISDFAQLARRALFVGAILLVTHAPDPAHAISFTPFGPGARGGSTYGQFFDIGDGGEVNVLDAYVSVAGGLSASLAAGGSGVDLLDFESTLSGDETDVVLRYTLHNAGASTLSDVRFFSLLDVEIDESTNGFFNEFGTVTGTAATGQGWEIDELGFAGGNLVANILGAALEDANDVPAGSPDDVAMALSFALGSLAPGESRVVEVMISEDGDALGTLVLEHEDLSPVGDTHIHYSGQVQALPEPTTALLVLVSGAGLALRRRRA